MLRLRSTQQRAPSCYKRLDISVCRWAANCMVPPVQERTGSVAINHFPGPGVWFLRFMWRLGRDFSKSMKTLSHQVDCVYDGEKGFAMPCHRCQIRSVFITNPAALLPSLSEQGWRTAIIKNGSRVVGICAACLPEFCERNGQPIKGALQ
jgi:hypothetical protein